MDDYDEETEEVHNEEELANQVVVNRFKSSYLPKNGVILSNSNLTAFEPIPGLKGFS